MKKLFVIAACLQLGSAFAQDPQEVNSYKKSYMATVSESILSLGNVGNWNVSSVNGLPVNVATNFKADPIPRFSSFFHFGEQIHLNFASSVGIYTGFGIRNMGMINRLSDSVKVKQRVYSFGIPLAFKVGDMGKKRYAAFGAELEFFFNYKQKTFKGDGRGEKVEKFNEWASDRTELLNPSVFAEFCFGKGSYLKIRYYLNDFLVPNKQTYTVDGVTVGWTPQGSQLFAISYGKVLSKKRK